MKKFFAAFIGLALLAGCNATGGPLPDDLSPRENAMLLAQKYKIVLTSVFAAVSNPAMEQIPEVKAALKNGSQVATDAVSAYVRDAGNCVRDLRGEIVTAPEAVKPCDQRALSQGLVVAQAALSRLLQILDTNKMRMPE